MAIIATPLTPGAYVWGKGKAMLFTRLVKPDVNRKNAELPGGLQNSWTQTVQQCRIPHDPKTAPQLGIRALTNFTMRQWYGLDTDTKQYWKDSAPSSFKRAIAFYLYFQLDRWMATHTPSTSPYAPEESAPIAIAAHTYHPGTGFTTLCLTPADATSIYGLVILRSPTEIITPAHTQAITMIPIKTADQISYCDSPLAPGTYHYRAAAFNTDGTCGTFLPDETVTVV
jgi:hypothetical protein